MHFNKKRCSRCKLIQDIINFYKDIRTKDNLQSECKICHKKDEKKWRLKNLEKNKQRNKQYRLENKEQIQAYTKEYYQKNKKKRQEYLIEYRKKNRKKRNEYNKLFKRIHPNWYKEYQKNRIQKDIQFKLTRVLGTRLRSALKNNQKKGSAVKDLGCSVEFLKKYLEAKFQKGMTWKNHGYYGWHIDHIKPLSKFDLTKREQLLVACHYTNLQPMWWKENIKKGNKTEGGLIC